MALRSIVAGIGMTLLASFASIAVPGAIAPAQAQAPGANCVLISQTAPDEYGSYMLVYRCDGRRITVWYRCDAVHCVWDARDEY